MAVTGGSVLAHGAAATAYAICCEAGTLTLDGGTVAAIGGQCSTPSPSSAQAFAALTSASGVAAGTALSLSTNANSTLVGLTAPRTYAGYALLLSAPALANRSSYTLYSNGAALATFTLTTAATAVGQ